MARRKAEQEKRRELVELAQKMADNSANDGLRVVCIVTDATGEFVGVGMNTAGDDAERILRCALAGEGLEFHDRDEDGYSRRGRTTTTTAVIAKRTPPLAGERQGGG